jgi:NADH-quinone oxidoreductase subunit L
VRLSRYFWQTVDAGWIDGAVNGVGDLVRVAGARARRLQTGNVQAYALAMLIGALAVVLALVV